MTCGGRQGSILGPILFLIYINDLPDRVSSTCKIFADDTNLLNFSSKSSVLRKDLYLLQRCSDLWQLQFNIKNARFYTGAHNPKIDYAMNHEQTQVYIENCSSESY